MNRIGLVKGFGILGIVFGFFILFGLAQIIGEGQGTDPSIGIGTNGVQVLGENLQGTAGGGSSGPSGSGEGSSGDSSGGSDGGSGGSGDGEDNEGEGNNGGFKFAALGAELNPTGGSGGSSGGGTGGSSGGSGGAGGSGGSGSSGGPSGGGSGQGADGSGSEGTGEGSETAGIPYCIDNDGDGYDTCDPEDAEDTDGLRKDCDDDDPEINPGEFEICGNGLDDNCDGVLGKLPQEDGGNPGGQEESPGENESLITCLGAECGNQDQCPEDPDKTEPGTCGCGVSDGDSDGDGVADCEDRCPDDNPDDPDDNGICGNQDLCPEDPDKTEPGTCGCGVSDGDSDGDGVADCEDRCPDDNPDDPDDNGICGNQDICPEDPEKTEPGTCGCGVSDEDSDGDGVADCEDENPERPGIPVPEFPSVLIPLAMSISGYLLMRRK